MSMRSSLPRRGVAGFTLIELLVVMAVLGILAAAVMPLGETLIIAQKERQLRQALGEIRTALDEYKKVSDRNLQSSIGSGYPPTLQAMVDGLVDNQPGSQGRRYYFLRTVPRDPFADVSVPAEMTWRLRSYASPANNPQPGADVYDVHSTSTATALDGSLYATW